MQADIPVECQIPGWMPNMSLYTFFRTAHINQLSPMQWFLFECLCPRQSTDSAGTQRLSLNACSLIFTHTGCIFFYLGGITKGLTMSLPATLPLSPASNQTVKTWWETTPLLHKKPSPSHKRFLTWTLLFKFPGLTDCVVKKPPITKDLPSLKTTFKNIGGDISITRRVPVTKFCYLVCFNLFPWTLAVISLFNL